VLKTVTAQASGPGTAIPQFCNIGPKQIKNVELFLLAIIDLKYLPDIHACVTKTAIRNIYIQYYEPLVWQDG
jgi:hypothetical protein